MFRTLVLATALLGLAACQGGSGGGGGQASSEIAAVNAEFQAAFNRGDPQAMAALYSEDAVILAPGAPWLEGRAAVAQVWQNVLGQGVRDLDLETVDLEVQRSSATELGRFTLTVPDGQGGRRTLPGKYVVHWKRDPNGAWRLHWDIWNDSPPQG
ncbi:MAG TPA: SgcJ/EcaC family oxidoreductase [Thermohalobaculum sp.]|nr:SgcJ/EcaC family oxidoreductase [Thermohalobaculum sp.]